MVKSVGGNYARGSKNWVEEIASIVGHDKVRIIISDILEITGAIISQGDPDLEKEIEEEKEASIQANKIIARKIFGYDDFAAVGMNFNLKGTDAKSMGDWDGSIAYRNLKQRICPTIEATFEAKEIIGEIHRDASTAEKITGLEFEEIRINHREHNFTLPTWEEFKDNIKATLSKGWEETLDLLKVERPIEMPVEGLPWLVNIPKIEVVEEKTAQDEELTSEAETKMCLINHEFVDELLAKSRDEAKYKEFVKKQLQKRFDLKLLQNVANKEAFDRYMREVYETSPEDGASSYGYGFQRFSEFMQDIPEDNIIATWAVRPLAKIGGLIVTAIDIAIPDLDATIKTSMYENLEKAGVYADPEQIDKTTVIAMKNLKEATQFIEFTPTQQYGMESIGTALDASIGGSVLKGLVVKVAKFFVKNTAAKNIASSKLQNLYYTKAADKIIDDVKLNPAQPVSEIVGKIYSESKELQTKLLGASDDAWKVPTTGITSSFEETAFKYNDKGGLIGTRKNPKEILGDLENPIVKHELSKMPDEVAHGRFDYRDDIMPDLGSFQKGTSKVFSGPLKEDMVLLNFFDSSKALGDGRTVAWATNPKVIEDLIGKPYSKINAADMDKICDHLGLVRPDWGARNAVNVIKIEKGTHVDFVSGAARFQDSNINPKRFPGGGFQVRFRDFDPKWIKETFDID